MLARARFARALRVARGSLGFASRFAGARSSGRSQHFGRAGTAYYVNALGVSETKRRMRPSDPD
jgi:hypothetical protein